MNPSHQILIGNCLELLRGMPNNSIDSIVTDPPYGLSFMGKRWDYDVPATEVWAECWRVLKPGGHLLAFAGTRTQHRMAVRIEDAGFEIRDMIAWVYGSGFPKSLDVSKAIDKAGGDALAWRAFSEEYAAVVASSEFTHADIDRALGIKSSSCYWARTDHRGGMPPRHHWDKVREMLALPVEFARLYDEAEREVLAIESRYNEASGIVSAGRDGRTLVERKITAPATDAARQWQGWGTALKPALETVTFASKPYTDGQERDIMLSSLIRLEARLWLLSSASAAEKNSTSNPSEYGAACGIAQWSAEETTSTRAALCDPMGMSLFELATTTSLNIVSSWRHTLAESWSDGNTSTTETKSSTTTDWKTLKFSLSQITAESIIKACSLPGGFSANASTAESHFNASLSLLQSIRTLSATERAMSQAQHEHQGAGVKPNLDPCIMARKPLAKGNTVAANVMAHGTGALNIDACRVSPTGESRERAGEASQERRYTDAGGTNFAATPGVRGGDPAGRWPANLIHDGSDEVVALFPESTSGAMKAGTQRAAQDEPGSVCFGTYGGSATSVEIAASKGSAARFFYCAKASRSDRNEGTEALPQMAGGMVSNTSGQHITRRDEGYEAKPQGNHHPTVKPTDLMAYLCRLVTPAGGTVLDPFMGSGSTGKAAIREGFSFIGCELSPEYAAIAQARIDHEAQRLKDLPPPSPQLDIFSDTPGSAA